MQIRKMEKEDIKRILEITAAAWGENTLHKLLEDKHGIIGNKGWKEKKGNDIINFCRDDRESVIVAVDDAKVIGYASFGIDEDGVAGNVLNNAVDPEFQGKGIGTDMNTWIIEYLKKRKVKIVKVSTLVHDKAARRIYEKNGFEEMARTIHYSMEL